ncbi:primosomal protein N' [Alkalilimnicola ehrlichii MLHE-1]|uniref:Replication restart protein PriA n=1 Tax=Alkalilimnicola ehrlichii (strain ATCC BAA-1101 / DSM 17681 / MLHE-1) TaxID=187272 RepID=Q0A5Q1_ALKEH|nr:primosomal protein N' [Alkalilimnicola ehrlichii]ABI57836.1 replication restart DNA helicase PriA [Alkalilimnicola ehrlichii MLHE-1]
MARILRVALPVPLYTCYDYLPPPGPAPAGAGRGCRVRVPFGRGRRVGVVVGTGDHTGVPRHKLRRAQAWLDPAPLLDEPLLSLLEWAAGYYHHPLGEVLDAALPTLLRQGEPAEWRAREHWFITAQGRETDPSELKRAVRQAQLLARLQAAGERGLDAAELAEIPGQARRAARALADRGLAVSEQRANPELLEGEGCEPRPEPLPEQQAVLDRLQAAGDGFQPILLEGVTGSGKTEVYLRATEQALAAGRQVLLLVPEIGLTPQLLHRFRRRLAVPMAVFHSGLNDRERLDAWLAAREGRARVVIGTRSAVFAPLPEPGLILVDEEHDTSFKQQDGFRYSARDLAVMRARRLGVPVLLGTATPSLESLQNALSGRYAHLHLRHRAGGAAMPSFRVLDVRGRPLREGLSPALQEAMATHLAADGQVLLFLNRRGFAPTLLCHECGWVAECRRCDARYTWHRRAGRLRCHHCGDERPVPRACPDCGSVDLRAVGQGTERVERALAELYPQVPVLRIDRDSTRRRGALDALLAEAGRPGPRILLGTQMLAKGHHFPDVTLVGVLDADHGLYGADFRALERMAQLLIQVAGRAGRAERPGEVLIQTHHPEHPLLHTLLGQGYDAFARAHLEERRAAGLPPFAAMALLRAEAVQAGQARGFLQAAAERARALTGSEAGGVMVLGPVPAPMERRAGRYRAQLLLQAGRRAALHRLLERWVPGLSELPAARQARWSLDVDPQDMF